jgi:hypothetical protein
MGLFMKSFIKKQNIVALLLIFGSATTNNIIHASQKPENCNSNSTPTNIEKEFDMLIDCALLNPSGSWFRKGGWECGKYFLPLSNDKANFKKAIEATDFSEEGQRIAKEFIERHNYDEGPHSIYHYIYVHIKNNPNYDQEITKETTKNIQKILNLAETLQDQIPRKEYHLYHNHHLRYATHLGIDECMKKWLLLIADKQDEKNIVETIARHKCEGGIARYKREELEHAAKNKL